jgi:hypothetical protein
MGRSIGNMGPLFSLVPPDIKSGNREAGADQAREKGDDLSR